ncbi:prolipoprotein diacylglyceryl transferase [Blattabacterium cuenoti]|uniref:prolipoprotein diacylglyceryl transferase n=1 Tax=Blattabacterium cuenoti TaxID=1653831 RepID=UPI00163C032F|nr:prolipoprotein diacylglyceryl transferase [Blattabacterium cuenoti]
MLFNYINWDPITKFILWNRVTIHVYSLMFVISFLTGRSIIKYIYKIEKIHPKYIDSLLIHTVIGTVLGSRLGQVFFYDFSYFSNHWIEAIFPVKENIHSSLLGGIIKGYKFIGYKGLSSHGATIGIAFSSFLYSKNVLKNKSFLWIFDRICIIAALSASFIRIGNFFNSEIVGKPSSYPWAVKFVQMDTDYGEVVPRHPTQIYESVSYFFLFLFLWFFYNKNKKRNEEKEIVGYISGIFFVFLWSIRFLLEFIKEPQGDEMIHLFSLNTGQLLSIPYIIFGLILLFFSKKREYFFHEKE